MTPDQRLLETF